MYKLETFIMHNILEKLKLDHKNKNLMCYLIRDQHIRILFINANYRWVAG